SDTDGDTDSDTYGNTGSDTDGDTDDDMDIDKSSGTVTIPAGTRLLTRLVNEDRVVLSEAAVGSAILQGAEFFETIHAIEAKPGYGMIQLYDWGGAVERLSRGATRATLELNETDIDDVKIVSGSVLLLEEIDDEDTGQPADPTHRHAVCVTAVKKVSDALRCDPGTDSSLFEVSWAENDALPFSLPLRHPSGKPAAVACGNVAIADYGRTVAMEPLVPEFVQPGERYRPRLRVGNVTHRVSLDETLRAQDTSGQLVQDPARALPVITVLELPEGSRSSEDSSNESQAVPWYPRGDLLASGPFDRHFALEVESDGTARLRFGDGVYGRLPGTESQWYATYRVGTGRAGNVGAGAIAHVIPVNGDESNQTDSLTIIGVRNPLPATGGQEPERDEQARLYAPYAFRFAQRAVTAEDYAEITERHPEVQKAVAEIRWSGSWNTVFITVDRRGGLPLDREFEAELRAFLEPFRMAGQDLEFIPPRFVALDIAFTVHVAPEHLRSEVEVVLLAALGNGETSAGKLGFFHPDNFTFGDPVYLSDLVAAAMEVPGVVWLDVDDRPPKENRFRRFGESSRGEVGAGQITVGSAEIIRVDNDPTAPYNGRLQLFMEGGL
ncbi:MAG: putative baseplate assembly protein, partial [Myxococcota bacterium]